MKIKYLFLTMAAALIAGCSDDLERGGTYNPEKGLTATIPTYPFDDGTRVNISDDLQTFTWSDGDRLGIYCTENDVDAAALFTIKQGGSSTGSFGNDMFYLNNSKTYYACYPFNSEASIASMPVDFTGQVQNGNGSAAHLGAYNYMYGSVNIGSDGGALVAFKNLGSVMQLRLTVSNAATYTGIDITSNGAEFITKGTASMTDGSITATETSASIHLDFENGITPNEGDVLTANILVAPMDMSGSTLTITLTDADNNDYVVTTAGKNMVQGKAYLYEASIIPYLILTADAYFAFRDALGRRFDEGNSCNSDEYTAISFYGDYLNGRDMANFSLHTISPSASDAQLGVYSKLTSGITKCNQLLYVDLADLGGEDSKLGAPVRAARAFYTFVLMDHWGDTPILDHIIADDEAIARSPRAEVARWIESELLAVRDKCPAPTTQDASTYGKPTRWMVDALLAKLYINWPVYVNDVTSSSWTYGSNEKLADCIAVCDDVIQHGPFDLSDDYVKKFQYDNGYKIKDFIYVMPFDGISQKGLTYARFRTWRQANKPGSMYDPSMTNSCAGNMVLTPEFVELFNLPGDRRNDVILGGDIYILNGTTGEATSVRATYNDEPLTFTKTITLVTQDGDLDCGKNLNGWCQGYRSVKFAPYVPEYNSYSRNQSNDVPIFRYADIILMKAEAILRGGSPTNGDTAVSLFNQIRSYVGAPTVESINLQDVEDERGREFLDEHWRRNDLIRFGHFERKWGFKEEFGSSDPRMRLWPLGQSTLNRNANWTQNAGY